MSAPFPSPTHSHQCMLGTRDQLKCSNSSLGIYFLTTEFPVLTDVLSLAIFGTLAKKPELPESFDHLKCSACRQNTLQTSTLKI